MKQQEPNRLFVIKKPIFISSNFYLKRIKRKFKVKKAGFSGTLDPFAKGCLITAFGQYTKLFRFLKKVPKTYRATLWLGTSSLSGDIENVTSIETADKVKLEDIKNELEKLRGDITYTPPIYSAKKIDGIRAYELAREGREIKMKPSTMHVYDIKFISYRHPFITFESSVSEGSYIRSLAQVLVTNLNAVGTLSSLDRLNEGEFYFENEKELNPLEYLDVEDNVYTGSKEWIEFGKKIDISYLEKKEEGEYLIKFDDFFSIILVKNEKVSYLLNKVKL
ncbi:tRNA pseudouridine(55) synthase TruB [Arcobacter sp. 31_11_sub10_T18]|nr:tRNA pseudouridine(55) synthase TruB [Arcobacter sp. 31_11_sub10_T18]